MSGNHQDPHLEACALIARALRLCSITRIANTLAQLPALKYLDMGYTELEGPLDSACGLAATRKLAQLNLVSNALSGSIPACLSQLPGMVELHLDNNQLTGTIPAFSTANNPMVYFTASFQVRLCAALNSWPHSSDHLIHTRVLHDAVIGAPA